MAASDLNFADPKLIENVLADILSRLSTLEQRPLQVSSLDSITQIIGDQRSGTYFGDVIAPAAGVTGSDPTSAGFTGSFVSGIGVDFGPLGIFNVGSVNGGVLEWGASQADGKFRAGENAIVLDATGERIYNGELPTGWWQTNGNLFLGSDIEDPSKTAFAFFAAATTYNGEAMGAGDQLFGDNSPDKSNIFWDYSDGVVYFRSGQTREGWIDTDGTAYFSGGSIRLSSSDFTSEIITNGDFEDVIPYATGGTITTSGGKRIHTFTSSGTFDVAVGGTFKTLRIGGGAGGGWGGGGGGGGAGGYVHNTLEAIAAGSYPVTIGAGGAGGPTANHQGADGGGTIFNGVTAAGGGGGAGSSLGPPDTCIGRNGASGGGGGGFNYLDKVGGSATGSQGQDGGDSLSGGTTHHGGGGGGGANVAGHDNSTDTGGDGGDGISCSISGSPVYYAGGGGGGKGGGGGGTSAGGLGGGGAGGHGGGTAVAGTDGLGGGGGGGSGEVGADGGDGVVIISYPDNDETYLPVAWTGTVGDGEIENSTTDQHDGSYAPKLTSGATSNTKLSQICTVSPSTLYQFSCWSRGDGTYDGRVAIYDVTHSAYILSPTPTGIIGTLYERFLMTLIIPSGCTSVRVELWCPSINTGFALFDDVHLVGQTIGNAYFGGNVEAGSLTLGGNEVNEISTDITCAGDSNLVLPTEHVLVTWCGNTFSALGHTHAGYQPSDATLTALAALGTAANKFAYTTGPDAWAEAPITAAGRAILDDAAASDQRTTLGLGGAAVLNVGTVAGTVAAGDDARFGAGGGGGCPARAIMGV